MQIEFIENNEGKKKDKKSAQNTCWYLKLDSKLWETSINCENIEEFKENTETKLELTYYLPDEKKEGKFVRHQDFFDCCENKLILKTFQGCHK